MAGREAAAFAAAAIEEKIAGTLPGRRKVLVDRLARLLGDLEPDRKTGLVLPNGRAVDGVPMWRYVLDLEAHHDAATQLAIDRKIEERQVPRAPCELQARPMAQTCFGWSGGFGPISLPLFQGRRCARTALVWLTVSMVLLPFLRRRPSMLRR